jgi:CrcB protein
VEIKAIIAVFLGGGIGSVLRWSLSLLLPSSLSNFPWATLVVNLVGSMLIGFFASKFSIQNGHPEWMGLFWITGVCGGFTTFSTFSKETVTLIQNQQYLLAGGYVVTSVALCLLGTFWGFGWGKA